MFLGSLSYDADTKTWYPTPGAFAQRGLPEPDYVDYRLDVIVSRGKTQSKCSVDICGSWAVVASSLTGTFMDKALFLKNLCVATPKSDSKHTGSEVYLGPRRQILVTESKV
ncbi:hypothetical protein BGZ58_004951 [Dissophora ornata]|nr:hypothetical protein BGZ58_004951 [Dissophora ornata]